MKKLTFIMLVFIIISGISFSTTRRALLIGINDYKPDNNIQWRDLSNLHGCVNDVTLIKETIKQPRFGFTDNDINVLLNSDASRQNIISSLENLADVSSSGDIVFIYYSGHGSQWEGTVDEADNKGECILPADGYDYWKNNNGQYNDILDKELKKLLNNILAKGVTLTVIMDCCHSGSGTRGIPPADAVYRYAAPVKINYSVPDNEPKPGENPLALILAAAHEDEKAREDKMKHIFEDNDLDTVHGVFTAAFVKAVNNSSFNEPIEKVFIRTRSILERKYIQIPDIECSTDRLKRSLFGSEVSEYKGLTMVPVANRQMEQLILNGGRALGLKVNCELVKRDKKNNELVRIKITELIDLNRSIADIISGNKDSIQPGDLVELDKKSYGGEANIKVYIAPSNYTLSDLNEITSRLKLSNPVTDPTKENPECVVNYDGSSWSLVDKTGKSQNFGANIPALPKGKSVFVNLPATASLYNNLVKSFEEDNSVEVVSTPSEASYILAGRNIDGKIEYSWMMQNANEKDIDSGLSNPVRTFWIELGSNENITVNKLNELAVMLGRILAWKDLADEMGGKGSFPYSLALQSVKTNEVLTKGPVYDKDTFNVLLVKDPEKFSQWNNNEKRFVYVFAIDCDGKMGLLYPDSRCLGINNTRFPDSTGSEFIKLSSIYISPPFGNDSYFLLTTNTLLEFPCDLFNSGPVVRDNGYKGGIDDPLTELLSKIGTRTRGTGSVIPTSWSIERVMIKSASK